MDDEERKIGMLIAAFDVERGQLQRAIAQLHQTGAHIERGVSLAAGSAVEDAISHLNEEIKQAADALYQLQGFSWWRAVLQHAVVAVSAIAVTLLAVWWYMPAASDMNQLRAERDQLQASIEDLNQHGAQLKHWMCGKGDEPKRFCILVPKKAKQWANLENPNQVFVVPVGY